MQLVIMNGLHLITSKLENSQIEQNPFIYIHCKFLCISSQPGYSKKKVHISYSLHQFTLPFDMEFLEAQLHGTLHLYLLCSVRSLKDLNNCLQLPHIKMSSLSIMVETVEELPV